MKKRKSISLFQTSIVRIRISVHVYFDHILAFDHHQSNSWDYESAAHYEKTLVPDSIAISILIESSCLKAIFTIKFFLGFYEQRPH